MRNPADPDSSYNAHRGQGYMVQVMETYEEDDNGEESTGKPDLITHVRVHKMTLHDGHQLEPALADVTERDARPSTLLADSHYGSKENVQKTEDSGVELVSPAMPAKGSRSGRLTLEDFEVSADGTIERCPAGHAPLSVNSSRTRLEARCPTQTTRDRGSRSRVQYTPERIPQRARRLAEKEESFRQRYRWRAGVEGTMSRLKHQMNLAALRVRGMRAVRYTTLLRALGLNLLRCAASEAFSAPRATA